MVCCRLSLVCQQTAGKLSTGRYRKHSSTRSKSAHVRDSAELFAVQQNQMTVCSVYGDIIPGHVLADRIASYIHIFNLYWYVRYGSTHRHKILLHCNVQDVCLVTTLLHRSSSKVHPCCHCYVLLKCAVLQCHVLVVLGVLCYIMLPYCLYAVLFNHKAPACNLHALFIVCCRPCGASTLLATFDSDGPQLYLIEPMGIALVGTVTLYGLQDFAAK